MENHRQSLQIHVLGLQGCISSYAALEMHAPNPAGDRAGSTA